MGCRQGLVLVVQALLMYRYMAWDGHVLVVQVLPVNKVHGLGQGTLGHDAGRV